MNDPIRLYYHVEAERLYRFPYSYAAAPTSGTLIDVTGDPEYEAEYYDALEDEEEIP